MSGIRQILGVSFVLTGGVWVAMINNVLKITLEDGGENKCVVHDMRDGSDFPFKSVTAAKAFSKRRRHGRTMDEHTRAESLQEHIERFGWSKIGRASCRERV